MRSGPAAGRHLRLHGHGRLCVDGCRSEPVRHLDLRALACQLLQTLTTQLQEQVGYRQSGASSRVHLRRQPHLADDSATCAWEAHRVDVQDRVCRSRRCHPRTRWRRRPVPRLIGFDYVRHVSHVDDAGDWCHRQKACHRLMQQRSLRPRMTNEMSRQPPWVRVLPAVPTQLLLKGQCRVADVIGCSALSRRSRPFGRTWFRSLFIARPPQQVRVTSRGPGSVPVSRRQ